MHRPFRQCRIFSTSSLSTNQFGVLRMIRGLLNSDPFPIVPAGVLPGRRKWLWVLLPIVLTLVSAGIRLATERHFGRMYARLTVPVEQLEEPQLFTRSADGVLSPLVKLLEEQRVYGRVLSWDAVTSVVIAGKAPDETAAERVELFIGAGWKNVTPMEFREIRPLAIDDKLFEKFTRQYEFKWAKEIIPFPAQRMRFLVTQMS